MDYATHRTGPWQRTGSSFMDGDPPHAAVHERAEWPGRVPVSTIWADAQRTIPLAFTDTDGCVAVILGDLDAAWAEAEAALPEGWCLKLHSDVDVDATDYLAIAQPNTEMPRDLVEWQGGPTPAAALRALTAKLRERGA